MRKYKLKVPMSSINIETWKHILEELLDVRETSYIIDINESSTFSWYYNGDFIKAIKAAKKSSHYSVDDEYVLININTKNVVSGDSEYILEKLENSINLKSKSDKLAIISSLALIPYSALDTEIFISSYPTL